CAAVPTIARTFAPEQFAMALGLAKALVGLSGSLAAQMYAAFFAAAPASSEDVDAGVQKFLLAVTAWFCLACVVGMFTLAEPPTKEERALLSVHGPMGEDERRRSDRWWFY
ncbi:hypothetical protein T492DRAFT_896025, partial [Pavlovales sp. CCMP2436]